LAKGEREKKVKNFVESAMQRVICALLILVAPLPPLYQPRQWQIADEYRRLNKLEDACLGKQLIRPLYAWRASQFGQRGKHWDIWIAESPTPLHGMWGLYHAWRGRRDPPA